MLVDPSESERKTLPSALDIPSYSDLPDEETLLEFASLREKVLREQIEEVEKRRASNPTPDEEELSAAAYREQIEPQCREAIFKIRRKGHDTWSSGFSSGNKFGNRQVLEGDLKFDQPTVRLLKKNGYVVYRTGLLGYHSLNFRPQNPDLQEITAKWNELADLLPDLGHPALPHVRDSEDYNKAFPSK